ncbi:hypothetical protein [Xanthobacter sp. ZOL 2024]
MPVEIKKSGSAKLLSALRGLTHNEALVGIPAENAGREPEPGEEKPPLNNAEIGYLMEFGGKNIPARSHLRPAIEGAKSDLAKALGSGVRSVLSGKPDAADKALHTAGMIGQNAVRNKITEGPFLPLAPLTLAKRKAKGRTGEKPLIDTGAYRNSQTYVVRKKGDD